MRNSSGRSTVTVSALTPGRVVSSSRMVTVTAGCTRGQPQAAGHRRHRRLEVDLDGTRAAVPGRGPGGRGRARQLAGQLFHFRRQVAGRVGRGLAADRPQAADGEQFPAGRRAQGPGHLFRRAPPGHVAALAGQLATHRVHAGREPRQALQGEPVLGRAGPEHLAVRQPGQQVALREQVNGGVDLRDRHVVPAGQRRVPGQPPARFVVQQRRRHPVGEHARRQRAWGDRPAVIACPRLRHPALVEPMGPGSLGPGSRN